MKKRTRALLTSISAILLALTILLGQSFTVIAANTEQTPEEIIKEPEVGEPQEIFVKNEVIPALPPVTAVSIASIAPESNDSKYLSVTVSISNAPSDLRGNYSVTVYSGSSKLRSTSVKTDESTLTVTTSTIKEGNHDIYAVLTRNGGDNIAESEHVSLTAVQQTQDSRKNPVGDITVKPSVADKATGSISIAGDYVKLAYYREGNGATQIVDGTTISNLEAGTYYVFAPSYIEGNTFYLSTGKTKGIKVEETEEEPAENPVEESEDKPSEEPSTEPVVEPETPEEKVPVKIEVIKTSFNQNPIYSEDNAYIQTTISVKVTDANGEAIADAKVYFKSDRSEKSFTLNRKTDESGIAEFRHSYGLIYEIRETEASFNPVFAFDSKFEEGVAETKLNLVLQQKKDLVLYTNQISGSKPEERKGKVTGLSDDYEIWGGDVHEYAIVLNSGEWIKPINGEVSGLRSGTNLIRFAAKVDEATNTYYFHSDYDYFEIPRLTKYEDAKVEDTSSKETTSSSTPSTGSSSSTSSSSEGSSASGTEVAPALLGEQPPINTNVLQNVNAGVRANTQPRTTVPADNNVGETENTETDDIQIAEEVKAPAQSTQEITTPNVALASGITDEAKDGSKLPIIIALFLIIVAGAGYAAYRYKNRIKE